MKFPGPTRRGELNPPPTLPAQKPSRDREGTVYRSTENALKAGAGHFEAGFREVEPAAGGGVLYEGQRFDGDSGRNRSLTGKLGNGCADSGTVTEPVE